MKIILSSQVSISLYFLEFIEPVSVFRSRCLNSVRLLRNLYFQELS